MTLARKKLRGSIYENGLEKGPANFAALSPLDFIARKLQPHVTVQGNLDPLLLVQGGDALERRVDEIKGALGAGPFIFNLGHGIVPQTPPEHVARLVELVRG